WEIALAWAERRRDRWLPKRQSQRKQLASNHPARTFTLKAPAIGRRLNIELYAGRVHHARWQLTSSDDEPVLLHAGLPAAMSTLEEASHLGALAAAQRNPALLRSATTDWSYNGLAGGGPGV